MIWCEAPLYTPRQWASWMRFAKGEEQDRIGSGIYAMPLQSVYIGELKWAITSYTFLPIWQLAIRVRRRVEIISFLRLEKKPISCNLCIHAGNPRNYFRFGNSSNALHAVYPIMINTVSESVYLIELKYNLKMTFSGKEGRGALRAALLYATETKSGHPGPAMG